MLNIKTMTLFITTVEAKPEFVTPSLVRTLFCLHLPLPISLSFQSSHIFPLFAYQFSYKFHQGVWLLHAKSSSSNDTAYFATL